MAHPILESSGVGPDILVSTLIAAPALSGTDSPDSYLDQGHDGLCRLSAKLRSHPADPAASYSQQFPQKKGKWKLD